MLKPAQNYITEIQTKYTDTMYNLEYQWYHCDRWTQLLDIPNDNHWSYKFASVNSNNEVIGYISYKVDLRANSCSGLTIISFDKGNLLFPKDVKQAIDDIFYKYNFDRLQFYCIVGNPALRGYRNFIKRYGGREVGTFKRWARLMDGQLYDSVAFEILKEDYKGAKQ